MTEKIPPAKLILFDLGGVLVELGPSPIPPAWLPSRSSNFSLPDWFCSPTATQFERGQCSPLEFAAALKSELSINATTQDIIEAFTTWPRGPAKGARAILERLKPHYRLAVLSNSNELHWSKLTQEFGFADLIEQFFSSHLLNLAKPDPAIFEHVLDNLVLMPHEVLFFDDNQQNINSAQSLGITSVLVNGPREIEAYMQGS